MGRLLCIRSHFSLELLLQLFVLFSILPDRFPKEDIPFISFIGIYYNISTIYNVTLKVEKIRGDLNAKLRRSPSRGAVQG
jgi:hypothetical protein